MNLLCNKYLYICVVIIYIFSWFYCVVLIIEWGSLLYDKEEG